MNREIKFRGMIISGEWAIGNLATPTKPKGVFISNSAGQPFAFEVRPETVSEFTGLKDKNNVDIFEGDIVQYPRFYETPEMTATQYDTSRVIFREGAFYIANDEYPFELDGCTLAQDMKAYDGNFEVIGNIFENPSLLPSA